MSSIFDPLTFPLSLEKPWRLTDVGSWHEHVPFALALMEMLRPKSLVELGTHKGDSYCAFCQAVQSLKLDCSCYAIDTWEGDEYSSFYGPEVLDELRAYHDPLYGSFSRLIKSTFDQALGYFSEATIDLLHIDGAHSYDEVQHDFSVWLPKMSDQGVVLLHDTNVREREFGVWRLWGELRSQYPSFEFTHGFGLGVLGVGKRLPAALHAFFSLGTQERVLIRNYFSALGCRVALEGRVKAVEARCTSLERDNRAVQEGYEAQIKLMEEEKAEIHRGYQKEVERLNHEYMALDLELGHVRGEYDRVAQDHARLVQELANLEQVKRQLDENLMQVGARLCEIESSLAWYMVVRLRSLRDRLLPYNTVRRRLFQSVLKALVVLYREGFRALCGKACSKFRSRRNMKESLAFPPLPKEPWRPLTFPRFDKVEVSIVIPVYNQSHYTFNCLQSILSHTNGPYEVIVIDNASVDETTSMLGAMENIRVIRNQENQGFVVACNQGAKAASGVYLLFLNNDTEVASGWMEALLAPLEDQRVGITGAKLLYPSGRLQEAGNIIWRDGTGWNYGRGDDPGLPEYSFLREVDYCSGACLMIRRSLWEQIGGFDPRFAPAYYEDTDLCFSVRQRGYKVMYQPEARVIHYEGVSAGTDLNSGYKQYQQVNLARFRDKWRKELAEDHFESPGDLYLARERGYRKRILVVDHYAPTFDMDSGSLRMYSLLKIMVDLGHKVVFWPHNRAFDERYTSALQRLGIEAIYGDLSFESYMKLHGQYFDVIILSRPNIAIHYAYAAKKFSKARIIYDTVDLHFLREERKAKVEGGSLDECRRWKDLEFFLAHLADDVLVVSPVEKEILEQYGFKDKVSVVPNIHSPAECNTPFAQREGMMFIGGFTHLPNEDAVVWFVERILPLIRRQLPTVSFLIVGSNPPKKVKALASSGIIVTGYVPDAGPYFEKARVFVSPLRYGAGLKGKLGQSFAYGLPVVTTSIGAEGFALTDGRDAFVADTEEEFAEKVTTVYQDENLWETFSRNGRALVEQNFSPEAVKEKVKALLDKAGSMKNAS